MLNKDIEKKIIAKICFQKLGKGRATIREFIKPHLGKKRQHKKTPYVFNIMI